MTPARISVAASRSRRAERPTAYVSMTATDPPTKAATGSILCPRSPSGRYAIAMVAPRPAPAATPSRYGSASGLRKTPWYVAPASASIAPTSAARTTRGTRISHRIASSVGESDVETPGTPSRAAADSSTAPTPRSTGPTRTPITSATTRNATAEHTPSGPSPRARTSEACSAMADTATGAVARARTTSPGRSPRAAAPSGRRSSRGPGRSSPCGRR